MQEGRSLLTPLLPTFTLINTSQIPGDGSLHDRLKRTFAQTFRLWTICSDKGARKTCDKRLCGSIIYTHAQIPNWQQQMHTHETDLHWCHLITPSLLVTISRKSFSNSVRTRIPQDHGGVIHVTVRSPWECLTATLHHNIMSFDAFLHTEFKGSPSLYDSQCQSCWWMHVAHFNMRMYVKLALCLAYYY